MKGSAFGKRFCCNRFDRHCHCTFRYYILHVSCPRRSSRKHRQSELVELGNFRGNHKPICIARHPVPKTIVILHFVLYDHWSAFSYKTMPQKLLIFFFFFFFCSACHWTMREGEQCLHSDCGKTAQITEALQSNIHPRSCYC